MNTGWLLLRIRRDYWFAPRHEEYRRILQVARHQQYQTMSLRKFYLRRGELAGHKVLALRHDVDTCNRRGVKLFFDLEREFGVSATYYFRLATLKMTQTVRAIQDYGSEVGYHFEEPATLAKRARITSRRELDDDANRKRIDEMMTRNIRRINAKLGIQIQSLSSHNDSYNRRLGVENHAFLSDQVRQRFNVLFEAHDPSFKGLFDECIHDVTDNAWLWHGDRSPVQAMLDGVPRLYVLTHPRQWHPAPIVNTRENVQRLFEERYYRSLGL